MGLDGNIRSWVGNAGEDEAIGHLVFVEERLVGVVDGTVLDKTGARAASSSFAGVWQVNAGFLGSIEDVDIIGALDLLLTIRCDKGHVVGCHHLDVTSSASAELGVEVVSHWSSVELA